MSDRSAVWEASDFEQEILDDLNSGLKMLPYGAACLLMVLSRVVTGHFYAIVDLALPILAWWIAKRVDAWCMKKYGFYLDEHPMKKMKAHPASICAVIIISFLTVVGYVMDHTLQIGVWITPLCLGCLVIMRGIQLLRKSVFQRLGLLILWGAFMVIVLDLSPLLTGASKSDHILVGATLSAIGVFVVLAGLEEHRIFLRILNHQLEWQSG